MRQGVQTNLIFTLLGVALITIGGCLLVFFPAIFKMILVKQLVISDTSESFNEWKRPSVELYLDVYLFNWTNAEEFVYPNYPKPVFEELGPYRFREFRDKVDLKFHEHNSTVSYKPISTYVFDEEGSNGSLDDIVININMVAIGAAAQSTKMEYTKRKVISQALTGYDEYITVNKTARELLFEGYEDSMVTMGQSVPNSEFNTKGIPYDKIGWFYMRNSSTALSGVYNVNTGRSDASKLGTIQDFNGSDFSKIYKEECSKVYGSTGELYPPDAILDILPIFTADMCRTLPFDFDKEVYINGVKGYRYLAGERLIDNGTKYAENLCYSEGRTDNFPNGVFNISACRYSSPVFMSYPHFYGADEYYGNQIEGMNPDREKHESYITIEPMTGVPLEIAMRFQANFLLRDVEDIALYQLCPTAFIPGMWAEQKYKINEAMAEKLKIALKAPYIGQIVGLVVFILGLLCVLTGLIIKYISRRKSLNDKDENMPEMQTANRKPNEDSPPLINGDSRKPNIKIVKMNQ